MIRKLTIILTFTLGLSTYSSAYADPDKTTNQIMNEPASLFDLGMLRLQLELENIKQASGYPESFAILAGNYVWNKDQIVIFTGPYNQVGTVEEAKSGCKQAFKEIREYALVNTETGKLLQFTEITAFAGFFSHTGYSISRIQESLAEFDEKFVLRCRCRVKGSKDVIAEAPLISNKIFFEG